MKELKVAKSAGFCFGVARSVELAENALGAGKKVYSKTIPLSEVAWISGDEGQYAKLEGNK